MYPGCPLLGGDVTWQRVQESGVPDAENCLESHTGREAELPVHETIS